MDSHPARINRSHTSWSDHGLPLANPFPNLTQKSSLPTASFTRQKDIGGSLADILKREFQLWVGL
jgi:hypothetical protein